PPAHAAADVTPSLELSDVGVRYASRRGRAADRPALSPFRAEVSAGEWVGVIGPNGAGKSSLLRAIAGLVDHDGRVLVDGVDLTGARERVRASKVAYVAQEPIIPDDMTTREYVLLGRTPYVGYFGSPDDEDHAVVDDVIARLRLGDLEHRRLGEASGGERQRAVLARALAQQAPVLLLDEPTSALDIGHQQQALELVTELREQQQLTVVSALHDLTLAATYTDRLVMLAHGEVVASGAARDVLTAERVGAVYQVCVTVEEDPDDGIVVVVPRRGFSASGSTTHPIG
ncbi:MAG: ABC transporter ATP-binding protein, partial [Actinomycetota bacterium]